MSEAETIISLLTPEDIDAVTTRLADEIYAAHGTDQVCLVGIYTRGAIFAERVYAKLKNRQPEAKLGALDISLYRDDLDTLRKIPHIRTSDIPDPVDGTTIILFDDVLFTGRTIRAAMEVLTDYGRPDRIELATLIDRGNRELPIQPNYVGHVHETQPGDKVRVRFLDGDEEEGVFFVPGKHAGASS